VLFAVWQSNVSSYGNASFTELEGYLVGRMIVDTLFRMRSRYDTILARVQAEPLGSVVLRGG
jgi:hypothetical protein